MFLQAAVFEEIADDSTTSGSSCLFRRKVLCKHFSFFFFNNDIEVGPAHSRRSALSYTRGRRGWKGRLPRTTRRRSHSAIF